MSREQKASLAAWASVAIAIGSALISYGALAQRVDHVSERVTAVERDRRDDSERLRRIERTVTRICALQPGCTE